MPDAGTEDPEHPAAQANRLQRQLTRIMDTCTARGLLMRARQAGDWEREWLLAELATSGCGALIRTRGQYCLSMTMWPRCAFAWELEGRRRQCRALVAALLACLACLAFGLHV